MKSTFFVIPALSGDLTTSIAFAVRSPLKAGMTKESFL